MREIMLAAKTENLDKVLDFVNAQLDEIKCPAKARMQLDIAAEEIFVNIAHYAYGSQTGTAVVQIEIKEDPRAVIITFIDNGDPYDPLARSDPDITLSVEDRNIGGLGVYMVKMSMDSVSYEYKYGQNIFKIQKKI